MAVYYYFRDQYDRFYKFGIRPTIRRYLHTHNSILVDLALLIVGFTWTFYILDPHMADFL